MTLKYIVKNKRNHKERLELTLEEFKVKFKSELKTAIDCYTAHEKSKNYFPPYVKPTPNYESDFYFDLLRNFNDSAQSAYYIERII